MKPRSPLPALPALAVLAALFGCAARSAAQSTPAVSATQAPIVWGVTGDAADSYALTGISADGRSVSMLRTTPGSGFGAAVARLDPAPYRGRRIRYSAVIRSEDAIPGASTWLRIDGSGSQKIALENNSRRALSGTVDWTEQVTELDVPDDAQQIWFGLILSGAGAVHARNVRVEAIDRVVTPLAWHTDKVGGSSPFYEVVDTSALGHALTLRRMDGGSTLENEFGTATTMAPATGLGGRRVTVRAMVRTRDAAAASIWVRAEGGGKTLALENNMARAVTGTTEWTPRTAVLDFPAGTEAMAYGLLLMGRGSVSVRDLTVSSAPITGAAVPGVPMNP